MRTIAFLALLALTANAFNLTAYHLGVDDQLGLNATDVQDGLDCLNALSADGQQIYQLIESKDIDNIVSELGGFIAQMQTDIQTTCKPYFYELGMYYYEQIGPVNVTELIKKNFDLYFAQVIQQIAHWVNLLEAGQDYEAGQVQSYIGQVLNGIIVPVTTSVPAANTTVPFNTSKFMDEYFTTIFDALGIDAPVNVTALVQCQYSIENVTGTFVYIKEQFSTMDFNAKLNAIQYVLSLGFETVRNCESAAGVIGNIMVPQYDALIQDPLNFTLTVLNRVALDLPQYITSIEQEKVDIIEGDYVAAGELKAERIINDFQGLVNYTITN